MHHIQPTVIFISVNESEYKSGKVGMTMLKACAHPLKFEGDLENKVIRYVALTGNFFQSWHHCCVVENRLKQTSGTRC